jgi:hypothetical protein
MTSLRPAVPGHDGAAFVRLRREKLADGLPSQPRHPTDPHRDLDLASYGVVAVLGHERGTTYPDMAWEPKQVFGALAAAYARARP